MIRKGLITALLGLPLVGAFQAEAQFLAADLIYVPGAAHTSGLGASEWRSDFYITNVEVDVAIDVAMVFLPSGLTSNASRFYDRSTWLGGRDVDGFGSVDPLLADIPPGGTIVLRDPIGNYFLDEGGSGTSGGFVIFVYEANTLEDDGTRVQKNGIVNTRVYTSTSFYQPDPENDGEFVEVTGTYGQTLPGVPWYNLSDPSAVTDEGNFSFQLLTGAGADDEMRYNLGIVNASDPLTTIVVSIQPFRGNGEPFFDIDGNEMIEIVTMPPVSQVQYNGVLSTLFGIAAAPDDVTIDVSFLRWSSGNNQPIVGMTTYGTYIDNNTNDPTAILPAFAYPYNVDCQWSSGGQKAAGTAGGVPRVGRRPLEIPARRTGKDAGIDNKHSGGIIPPTRGDARRKGR